MSKIVDRDYVLTRVQTNRNLVLLEALPEKYFREWHLPGARHMPHDQVLALAGKAVPDKAAEIIVYCASASCQNSHVAANTLTQMGYANVAVYGGGKQDWQAAGLPSETAATLA